MNVCGTAILLALTGLSVSQTDFDNYYCKYLAVINCSTKPTDEQCGTDGVTYRTNCDFAKAHCAHKNIHLAKKGPCTPQTTAAGTTAMPMSTTTSKPINGAEVAFDIFCLDLFHHDCSGEPDNKVCANDQMTYRNLCEYEKKKCLHRHMTIAYMGECK